MRSFSVLYWFCFFCLLFLLNWYLSAEISCIYNFCRMVFYQKLTIYSGKKPLYVCLCIMFALVHFPPFFLLSSRISSCSSYFFKALGFFSFHCLSFCRACFETLETRLKFCGVYASPRQLMTGTPICYGEF